MSTLVSTTDSEQNMRDALRSGDAWKSAPEASAAEAPKVSDDGVLHLDRLDPKEFKEVRDAQERDKKENGPEFLRDNNVKPRSKSKAQKTIDKLTAKHYQALSRAEAAERRIAELESAANGNGAALETSQAESAQPETQDEFAANRDDAPSASPRAELTPAQAQQYERTFAESAQRIPGFDRTLAAANQINVSDDLARGIRAAVAPSEIPHVIQFLTNNPRVLEALEADSASVLPNVARLASDLKASRTASPSQAPHVNAAAAQTPEQERQHLGNTIHALGVDNWSDVLDHLDSNPEIRSGLLTFGADQARARIKAIAAQLKANSQRPPKERVQPPAPISPVGASSAATSVPLDKLPPREYNRIRNEQERRRKRGR